MVNVIPQEMQKAVHRAMRARFILVTALVLLVSAGISILILLPSYFLVASTVAEPVSVSSTNLNARSASDTVALVKVKSLLTTIAPLIAASTSPSEAILSALALEPSGVSIDQITYTAGAPSSVMLVGSAASNSDISAYKLALGNDPLFSSVIVPVGALVGTDGGRFSITLQGKF